MKATGATTGPTLTNTTGSSSNPFLNAPERRKEDSRSRNQSKENKEERHNQSKERKIFSFDSATKDGIKDDDVELEQQRAPSIADIISESIAESIEIVDDEYQDRNDNSNEAALVNDDDDDDDRTIRNELEEKLKVPKVVSSMDSIRRESQDTVIFAPKKDSSEYNAPKSDRKGKLKKKLSFHDSFPSDADIFQEDASHQHKKKKKKKHKRKSRSETSTSESLITSKSEDVESSERERKSESKHSRREKHKRKSSRSSNSCWYCKHSCDYHRDKNLRLLSESQGSKSGHRIDESVQAGPSCLPWNEGMSNRHYLFDPCADALYDYPRSKNYDNMDSYRYDSKSEAAKIAKLYLTTNPCQGTSSSFQHKESLIKDMKTIGNSNPMAFALSELLRGQLDLTANFLASQKQMYATYCANLEMISKQNRTANEIATKKLRRTQKIEEQDEEEQELPRNGRDEENLSIKEDLAIEEYESEFEQDDSEDNNSPVEMETNFHSNS